MIYGTQIGAGVKRESVIGQLLARLHVVDSPASRIALIAKLVDNPVLRVVSFLNAHAVNLAYSDGSFENALTSSDLLLRDGIGIKIACWLARRQPGLNLNGTDFIPELISAFGEQSIMLCGSRNETVNAAAMALNQAGVRDIFTLNGFESDEIYVRAIRAKKPDLVVLGLGMPKQELLAQKLKTVCASAGIVCTIVNGGAIVDFMADRIRRAPLWMRHLGLEWLFRLIQEPRRLAHRYIVGNPIFLARAATGLLARVPRDQE